MIRSFKDKATQWVFEGRHPPRLPQEIAKRAYVKLRQLDAAGRVDDFRVPPGNRLEALSGDRKGQHSIRVNDQWRICFTWTDHGAEDVEIVDYHR